LDDKHLKAPGVLFRYFGERLRRIQDIRSSEKRFYEKITNIHAPVLVMIPFNIQAVFAMK